MTFVDETKLERIGRFGILPGGSKADTQEGIIEKMIAGAVELTERFEAEVARMKKSGAFTRVGLRQRKAEMAREALQNLSVWEGDLKNKRKVLASLRDDLRVKPRSRDETAHQVLLAEIRAAIREVHDLERIALLNNAVEKGDRAVFEAIDSWPEHKLARPS